MFRQLLVDSRRRHPEGDQKPGKGVLGEKRSQARSRVTVGLRACSAAYGPRACTTGIRSAFISNGGHGALIRLPGLQCGLNEMTAGDLSTR